MGGATTGPLTAGAAAVAAERGRILHDLLEDLEALAEQGMEAIRAEIPAYADLDERFAEDVRDQVLRHYRANIASFAEERDVTLEDIAFTRGAASRRARVGFGLDDYLNAYRVGRQVLWDAVVARAGESPLGHEAALTLATPVMHYADFASTFAARAYVEFQQYVVADADRERRDLLEHLLSGELPAGGPLLSAAQGYGIGADTRMVVVAAVSAEPGDGTEMPHAASAAIARSGLNGRQTLVVVRQSEIVAVPVLGPGTDAGAVCDRLEALGERLRREHLPLTMGISTVAEGVGELPRAYAEARDALSCLAVGDEGGLAALPRLRAFEYLAMRADGTARRLVDPRVRAFLDEDRDRGGVLTSTVRTFASSDLNLRVAAEALQVHQNTAQYRLNRIEERTGRNPRRIADLIDLLVAIELDRCDCRAAPPPVR
jgi:sugar diacid utilization regulator